MNYPQDTVQQALASMFAEVRDGRYTGIRSIDVDLSTARTQAAGTYLDIPAAGTAIYINADPSDGNAVLVLQAKGDNVDDVNLYASPGAIFEVPFTRIRVYNTAQAGKKIRIVYGTNVRFQPGSVAQIAITGNGGYTAVRPEAPTGTWTNTAALAANTATQIVPPATNVNGMIVQQAHSTIWAGSITGQSFLAKNGAPASIADGQMILGGGGAAGAVINLALPQYVPAGRGLYFYNVEALAATAVNAPNFRSAAWKLL